MYSTLLFDNDNTLLDFEKAEDWAIKKAFAEAKVEICEDNLALYKKINDNLWKKLETGEVKSPDEIKTRRFAEFFRAIDSSFSPFEMGEVYAKFLSQAGFLKDGVLQTLKTLYGRYKMYIITNGIAVVQRSRIALSGIECYFEGIFISEEIGFSKPDKRYFDYVLARIEEKDKSKVLVIGDRVTSDIMGAVNSGLDSVLIGNYSDLPTYQIEKITEITKVLP